MTGNLDECGKLTGTIPIERMANKVRNLDRKQNPPSMKIPGQYMGILIGDKELNDMFGETVIDVAVYGGLQVLDNVKSFLRLPSGFRIYSIIDKTQV